MYVHQVLNGWLEYRQGVFEGLNKGQIFIIPTQNFFWMEKKTKPDSERPYFFRI